MHVVSRHFNTTRDNDRKKKKCPYYRIFTGVMMSFGDGVSDGFVFFQNLAALIDLKKDVSAWTISLIQTSVLDA